ncbi:MAG: hypothetical protein V4628_12905, partial [Pseudomonadota bacterium]
PVIPAKAGIQFFLDTRTRMNCEQFINYFFISFPNHSPRAEKIPTSFSNCIVDFSHSFCRCKGNNKNYLYNKQEGVLDG